VWLSRAEQEYGRIRALAQGLAKGGIPGEAAERIRAANESGIVSDHSVSLT
jgi:hypothetical protein